MDTRTRIQTESAMIRTKSKPKFVNIRIRFKFLTLKIQNLNRLTESEHIYECMSREKGIQQNALLQHTINNSINYFTPRTAQLST